jgi:hypothetical protein
MRKKTNTNPKQNKDRQREIDKKKIDKDIT